MYMYSHIILQQVPVLSQASTHKRLQSKPKKSGEGPYTENLLKRLIFINAMQIAAYYVPPPPAKYNEIVSYIYGQW